MTSFASSRRTFLKASAASLAIGGLGTKLARADEKPIIGIVYVGPRDDFGWNQAHAVAAKALKAIPGVTVVEDENIPETDACAKTMESMINLDGANIILGTSFGYFDPFMINLSKKYAKVEFRHAAPLWTPKLPKNLGSYFGYLNQAHYVDGVAAGLSTKSNKLGFVAAKPIASVLSNVNSFLLGASRQTRRRPFSSSSRATGHCRCAKRRPPMRLSMRATTSSHATSTVQRWS
jgi:simple sugar transport system substrate-binding protein